MISCSVQTCLLELLTCNYSSLLSAGHPAASSLFIILLLLGFQVFLLRLPWGSFSKEVFDAFLPVWRWTRTHRVPASVLVLCCE